ncbi:NmrA family NAD(P)-binding protein [Methylosinus sp. Sm6]|uniref:NmrA family NAD(P)-binding protein n=1 Tax=Methylosinus sp. Sm6 TaxID=2866948 RepID=UPI001C98FF6F|nr:NmrA family NAD(P)-binding protein [Methylosinus sp. Sm6]MBY6242767.1 NmrA family NAD(P)-binding protein [Methylosinus sp. Sm6]
MVRRGQVLVTGAAGTHGGTGRFLIEELIARAIPVRALARVADERSERLRALGAEIVIGDLTRLDDMRRALDGVDGVFFCYPLAPGLLQAAATLGAATREAGTRTIVDLSIMMAAPDHPSPVCRDHWLAERVLDWADMSSIHLRAGFFFENLLRFCARDIREDDRILLPFGEGDAALAWVGARDVAAVAAAMLAEPSAHAGRTFDVTGDAILSIKEIAEAMSASLGRPIRYEATPLADWLAHVAPILGENAQLRAHVGVLGRVFSSGRVIGRVNDLVSRLTSRPAQSAAAFAQAHAADFTAAAPASSVASS